MNARRRSAHLEEVAFVDVKVRKATYAKCENSVVRLTVTLEVRVCNSSIRLPSHSKGAVRTLIVISDENPPRDFTHQAPPIAPQGEGAWRRRLSAR